MMNEPEAKINFYDALNTLSYGRDSFTSCEEKIDVDALSFIVNNRAIFEPLLR